MPIYIDKCKIYDLSWDHFSNSMQYHMSWYLAAVAGQYPVLFASQYAGSPNPLYADIYTSIRYNIICTILYASPYAKSLDPLYPDIYS